ncbi:MAG: hypothetical protein ABR505_03190 [Actinomycetota bacterium]
MVQRLLALIAVTVLGAGAPASAETQRDRARTVDVTYEGGAVQYVACFDCPETHSRRGERFVSVEVIDDWSPIGYVDIYWEANGEEHFFSVCGATDEPQRIPAEATTFTIFPWAIPDPACPTGFTTSGTVKLTFTRKAP